MSQVSIILIVITAYFAILLALSFFSSRRADNATFFSGNRRMPWWIVAVAMLGAPISGVTLVSVPGMVASKGFSYLQMCLGFMVGYLIIAFVLIPVYYKLNIISVYSYLERRFGSRSSKTGAWLFIVSKILGISIRFLVVCAMLQLLVFDTLGWPVFYSVMISMALIWLSTFKGGVKSVIWTDVLKSVCLLSTVFLALWLVGSNLDNSWSYIFSQISDSPSSQIFFFDDPLDGKYFWKQFIAGIFIVVAMTGMDQDMMQRSLSCKSARDACKNLITASLLQVVAISLLLFLGAIFILFIQAKGMQLPEKSDNLFATIAFHPDIPEVVGILFVLGLISATFASVGSALTAMTTSVTVDLFEADKTDSPVRLANRRKMVHASISLVIIFLVLLFFYVTDDDALSIVYTLISYTDGPILGLFLFGLFTKRKINERWVWAVCIISPALSWAIQWGLRYFFFYETSFELLILNSFLTFIGLCLLPAPASSYSRSLSFERA